MVLVGSAQSVAGLEELEELDERNRPEGMVALGSCWQVLQALQVEEVLVSARWCSIFGQA